MQYELTCDENNNKYTKYNNYNFFLENQYHNSLYLLKLE